MKLSTIVAFFGLASIGTINANDDRNLVTIDARKRTKSAKKSSKSKGSKSAKKNCPAKSKSPKPVSAVYTMTNNGDGNSIVVYERDTKTGLLAFMQTVSTGGLGGRLGLPDGSPAGADSPIGSTNAITIAGRCLLAVNTGSNTISSFHISSKGRLTLADQQSSGGEFPVSVAEQDGLVYALNTGLDGSISGFNLLQYSCSLSPIADSTIDLELNTGLASGELPFFAGTPAQIQVAPSGNFKVSIKGFGNSPTPGSGSIMTFRVNNNNGKLIEVSDQNLSDSTVPFSFDITKDGTFLLTEAFGAQAPGTAGAGAIAIVNKNGVQQRVATGQTATCWLEFSETTSCIFATSTGGSSITTALLEKGKIVLKEAVAAELGFALDLILSADDNFLYVVGNGSPEVVVFDATSCHCNIKELQSITDGLPEPFNSDGNPTPGYNGIAGIAVWQS